MYYDCVIYNNNKYNKIKKWGGRNRNATGTSTEC